ncbi:MAG: alpha/beta hydrolase [Gammaproteobacteria bacterium]|nr:alpha/beta hydrolase [Gammaproteobacteria bacterium]
MKSRKINHPKPNGFVTKNPVAHRFKDGLLISATLALFSLLMAMPSLSKTPDIAGLDDAGIKLAQANYDEFSVHYAYSGNPAGTGVLFIHGTPGSWQAFDRYLVDAELQNEFFMVSVDRPGWGGSNLPKQRIDGDFALQAQSIAAVMAAFPEQSWILVGHSLGASIAPQVALLRPHQVSGLLLLAGSLDPKLGRPRWFNRLAHTWLAKRLISPQLGRSNDEIMPLSRQLSALSDRLQQVRLPARLVVVQGARDNLVSPANPAYVTEYWADSFADIRLVELAEAGHFLPWRETALIIELIRSLATPLQAPD